MTKIKIGILDFGYRKKGTNGIAVLNDVFAYALLADQLGFTSYWLSEHHNSGLGWSNPEMLLPVLASYTERITIGIAGILLAIHSPYRVALNFKILSALFPGRIDLGLANGLIDQRFDAKLNNGYSAKESYTKIFNKKTTELLRYFQNELQLLNDEKIIIPPYGGPSPGIFRLSNTFNAIHDCIKNKMHYSKSMFHMENNEPFDKNEISEYRRVFYKAHGTDLRLNLAVSGLCASNMSSAKRMFSQLDSSKLETSKNIIVGCPAFVKDKLYEIYDQSGINEFIFHDQSLNAKSRFQTLEMLAKEFQLN